MDNEGKAALIIAALTKLIQKYVGRPFGMLGDAITTVMAANRIKNYQNDTIDKYLQQDPGYAKGNPKGTLLKTLLTISIEKYKELGIISDKFFSTPCRHSYPRSGDVKPMGDVYSPVTANVGNMTNYAACVCQLQRPFSRHQFRYRQHKNPQNGFNNVIKCKGSVISYSISCMPKNLLHKITRTLPLLSDGPLTDSVYAEPRVSLNCVNHHTAPVSDL